MKVSFKWHLKDEGSMMYPTIKWGGWGGGWIWKVGLQGSSSSIMLMLFICAITLDWYKEDKKRSK